MSLITRNGVYFGRRVCFGTDIDCKHTLNVCSEYVCIGFMRKRYQMILKSFGAKKQIYK